MIRTRRAGRRIQGNTKVTRMAHGQSASQHGAQRRRAAREQKRPRAHSWVLERRRMMSRLVPSQVCQHKTGKYAARNTGNSSPRPTNAENAACANHHGRPRCKELHKLRDVVRVPAGASETVPRALLIMYGLIILEVPDSQPQANLLASGCTTVAGSWQRRCLNCLRLCLPKHKLQFCPCKHIPAAVAKDPRPGEGWGGVIRTSRDSLIPRRCASLNVMEIAQFCRTSMVV